MANPRTRIARDGANADGLPLSDRILGEAASLFSEVGVGSASMRVLAERLGVTKAALYYHYRSKEELHLQIHMNVIDGALAKAAVIQASDQTAREKIRAVVALILESISEHRNEFTVLLREATEFKAPPWDAVWEKRERFRLMVREMLADGTRTGEFAIAEPQIAALALLGMCNWSYTWLDPAGRLSVPEISDAFATMFLRGIENEAPVTP